MNSHTYMMMSAKSILWWLTIIGVLVLRVPLLYDDQWWPQIATIQHGWVFSDEEIDLADRYQKEHRDTAQNNWDHLHDINDKEKETIVPTVPVIQPPIVPVKDDSPVETYDHKQLIEWYMQSLLSDAHGSAETFSYDDYTRLCTIYKKICDRIEFRWTFSTHDKTVYLVMNIYLQDFFTNNLPQYDVDSILEKIAIDSWAWNRRWLSSHTKVILYTGWMKSIKEFWEVMTHEMWHIVDLWFISGKEQKKDIYFTEFGKVVFPVDDPSLDYYRVSRRSEDTRRGWSRSQDFVSGYGMTNPFEDFAESFNLYINHYGVLDEYASSNESIANKKAALDQYLWWKYLSYDQERATEVSERSSSRQWDTTRMR